MSTITVSDKKNTLLPKITQPSCIVTNPLEKINLRIHLAKELLGLAIRHLKHPVKAIRTGLKLMQKYEAVYGEKFGSKIARVDGKYYWRLATPGFPSLAARRSMTNEINRVYPIQPTKGFAQLLLAITKKCPLSCEHCYEWDRLHQKEKLSTMDLVRIVKRYQAYGTTQILLGGGEPLLRIKDVYHLLQSAKDGTDFWINTSGWRFTAQQATHLKRHGLTGVMISLDHHQPGPHDTFRGREGSYAMAVQAALYAKQVHLVTGLSLCATRAFTTEQNLHAYMNLARHLGVTYVQFLEPQPVGRYRGKDVVLPNHQLALLEQFYTMYNNDKAYRDYPIINYVGYIQRRVGCFAGGDYYLYIDTNGQVYPCPMCSGSVGHALAFPVQDTIDLLQQSPGCGSLGPTQNSGNIFRIP